MIPLYLVDIRERCARGCGRYATHDVKDVDGKCWGRLCWSCAATLVEAMGPAKGDAA